MQRQMPRQKVARVLSVRLPVVLGGSVNRRRASALISVGVLPVKLPAFHFPSVPSPSTLRHPSSIPSADAFREPAKRTSTAFLKHADQG